MLAGRNGSSRGIASGIEARSTGGFRQGHHPDNKPPRFFALETAPLAEAFFPGESRFRTLPQPATKIMSAAAMIREDEVMRADHKFDPGLMWLTSSPISDASVCSSKYQIPSSIVTIERFP